MAREPAPAESLAARRARVGLDGAWGSSIMEGQRFAGVIQW